MTPKQHRASEHDSEELKRIFKEARQHQWPGVPEQLAYRHMIALADVFEGWALDKRLTPAQSAMIIGWAESMRSLAEKVGPNWNPPKPDKLTLVGFLGRKAFDE